MGLLGSVLAPFEGALDQMSSLADAGGDAIEAVAEGGFGEVPGLGTVINVIGAGANYADDLAKGQDEGEAAVDTGAKVGSGYMTGGGFDPVNFVNDTLKGLGASKDVTDITGLAADMTAAKAMENPVRQGARGLYNLITGDDEALERQGEQMEKGEAGGGMQGLAAANDLHERMENGEDPRDAFEEVGAKMEDSPVGRFYDNYLGDGGGKGATTEAVPEDGVYKATSGNAVIDYLCTDLLGL